MAWDIEYTDEFENWYQGLTVLDQNVIVATVEHLERDGPGLGRPYVDGIKGSSHSMMKELRPLLGMYASCSLLICVEWRFFSLVATRQISGNLGTTR